MPARVFASALLLALLAGLPAHAEPPNVTYCRQAVFRIPFEIEPGDQARLREVQLLVSEDQGVNWRQAKSVGPAERFFPFRADRDGLFLFAVRTLDSDNRLYPPTLDGIKPSLQVLVDTQIPVAALRSLPPRGEQVGIEWEVKDDTLNVQSLQIDYRVQGSAEWTPLTVDAQAAGQRYWTPQARALHEVRLRVQDKAGNQGVAQLFLQANAAPPIGTHESKSTGTAPDQNLNKSGRPLVPAGPNVKVVNTTKIPLNYALEEVGPSGISLVELWYTLDARSWQRYGEDSDRASPFIMEVNGEGTYGLTLVVRSGAGVGDKPPQLNDPPQMWVEVDLTKPIVQLFTPDAGKGPDAGNLTITWTASDKNLAPQPINLYYAEDPQGEWRPIITGLDNTGRYVWRVPPTAPFRFHIRAEAIDRGGNLGKADSPKPVIVDLAQPKGRILGVDAGKGTP